jgi:hypothetical protein
MLQQERSDDYKGRDGGELSVGLCLLRLRFGWWGWIDGSMWASDKGLVKKISERAPTSIIGAKKKLFGSSSRYLSVSTMQHDDLIGWLRVHLDNIIVFYAVSLFVPIRASFWVYSSRSS